MSDISDSLKARIPVLAPGEDYIDSVFLSGHLPGFPSFIEYLRDYRKIPLDTIPKETWYLLALQTDMVMYNLVLKNYTEEKQKAAGEEALKDQLKKSSLNDLMMQRAMIQAKLDQVDHELKIASKEIVDQDKADKAAAEKATSEKVSAGTA